MAILILWVIRRFTVTDIHPESIRGRDIALIKPHLGQLLSGGMSQFTLLRRAVPKISAPEYLKRGS